MFFNGVKCPHAGKKSDENGIRVEAALEIVDGTGVGEAARVGSRRIFIGARLSPGILLQRRCQFPRLLQHIKPRFFRSELGIVKRDPLLVFVEARFFHLPQ